MCLRRVPSGSGGMDACLFVRLAEDKRTSRRSISDVLEVLTSRAAFGSTDHAVLAVGPMKLPSGQGVGLVQILFATPIKTYIVSLPTATGFNAVCSGSRSSRPEKFDIFLLDGATINYDGQVQLKGGVRLRAVTVIRAQFALKPTELDWRIVYATVMAIGAEKRCYRRPTDRTPRRLRCRRKQSRRHLLRKCLGDQLFLDCRALRGLRIPSLKRLIHRLISLNPGFANISDQKIANTLRMFGIRIPTHRQRVTPAAC